MHLEMASVQEQVVQPHPRQVADPPGGELRTDRRADPADGRARQRGSGPRTSARVASRSRSDRPPTQPEMTSDSNALVRVTRRRTAANRTPGRCHAAWAAAAGPRPSS
jgi:hypothetical protein